jgi:hypothetical protein
MTVLLVLGMAVLLRTAGASADTTPVPTPIGVGPMFHPGPTNASVERGLPVGALTCTRRTVPRSGVHLELFARGRVVVIPAGIGVAPPIRRHGAYVVSGRCSYPARTREPTGVIELARSTRITLGDFFVVWGRQLSVRRLLGFRAAPETQVRAYINGSRWHGGLRSIPLRRHDEIVLELGIYIPPHTSYRFPKGL